ncbi:MAG: hypothetical protein ABIG92_05630 [Candidatus Omnitrophota bacterium]
MMEFIRVWKDFDIDELSRHLLIVGSASGDCSNCRELGLDYNSIKTCTSCNTEFKYIASRTREIAKIKKKRPDLVFVEFEDYKRAIGKKNAKGLFIDEIQE